MTWYLQGVRCAAGHMGPALQPHIFVGQGPCALPWVRYGIGGRTEASAPTEMSEHLRRAACPHAAVMVRWLTGGGLRAARPTEAYFAVRRGGALPLPRATARVAPTKALQGVRSASGGRGRTPPLRRGYKECDAVRNPPVTAAPCQPPLGKGAEETGYGLPRAQSALAMTGGFVRGVVQGYKNR